MTMSKIFTHTHTHTHLNCRNTIIKLIFSSLYFTQSIICIGEIPFPRAKDKSSLLHAKRYFYGIKKWLFLIPASSDLNSLDYAFHIPNVYCRLMHSEELRYNICLRNGHVIKCNTQFNN